MTTSLQLVEARLASWRNASAANAQRATDPAAASKHRSAVAEFDRLLDIVSSAVVDLDAYREIKAKPAKRMKMAKAKPIDAVEFWRMHKIAVDTMIWRYGMNWAVKAPHGETVLATLPTKLTSFKGERGTKIKWRKDWRLPSAEFWPGRTIPAAATMFFVEEPRRHIDAPVTPISDATIVRCESVTAGSQKEFQLAPYAEDHAFDDGDDEDAFDDDEVYLADAAD